MEPYKTFITSVQNPSGVRPSVDLWTDSSMRGGWTTMKVLVAPGHVKLINPSRILCTALRAWLSSVTNSTILVLASLALLALRLNSYGGSDGVVCSFRIEIQYGLSHVPFEVTIGSLWTLSVDPLCRNTLDYSDTVREHMPADAGLVVARDYQSN